MGRDIARQNATVLAKSEPKVVGKFHGVLAENLDAGQQRALTAWLTGKSVTAAAKDAKVHRGTVYRWMTEDAGFIAEFNLARKEMAEAVSQEIRFLASEALGVLRTFLSDSDTPPALRLRAATEVLKMSSPLPEEPTTVEDVEAEIARKGIMSDIRRRLAKSGRSLGSPTTQVSR